MSAGLPALQSILIICSNSSDPPYSTDAPVSFSKIDKTSLKLSSSGANQGPKILILAPGYLDHHNGNDHYQQIYLLEKQLV